ncbi:MAG: hypothetical protein WBG51_01795, partial [Syntrophobacteria bacterium]
SDTLPFSRNGEWVTRRHGEKYDLQQQQSFRRFAVSPCRFVARRTAVVCLPRRKRWRHRRRN